MKNIQETSIHVCGTVAPGRARVNVTVKGKSHNYCTWPEEYSKYEQRSSYSVCEMDLNARAAAKVDVDRNTNKHTTRWKAEHFFSFFLIWFLWPFKLISLIWVESIARWGLKTGDPLEKAPDHPQSELSLSHMWLELGSNPQWWYDARFKELRMSGFNHSAMGAATGHLDPAVLKQAWQ